jgi:hypothetical protein
MVVLQYLFGSLGMMDIGGCRSRHSLLQADRKPEGAAGAQLAVGACRAAHQFGNLLGDDQT